MYSVQLYSCTIVEYVILKLFWVHISDPLGPADPQANYEGYYNQSSAKPITAVDKHAADAKQNAANTKQTAADAEKEPESKKTKKESPKYPGGGGYSVQMYNYDMYKYNYHRSYYQHKYPKGWDLYSVTLCICLYLCEFIIGQKKTWYAYKVWGKLNLLGS